MTLVKIDVTVNAPVSGTIVELLAQEEDTVSVGQELFRIEAGEAGTYHSSVPQLMSDLIRLAAAPPKEEKVPEAPTHSDSPKPAEAAPPKEQPAPPLAPLQKSTPVAPKEPKAAKQESKPEAVAPSKAPGSRNETRVTHYPVWFRSVL
jgi:2-oxoglutarate dehydrogenase E2 component (dihydrolipoamide succinyltransferase)